jgi:uncharacterized protein YjbI with pentapeptide repeats
MTAYVDVAFVYDVNASDIEMETLTYFDNASLGINDSTGLINWTPSSRAVFDVKIEACDTSGQSNNCTEANITMTVKSFSTIISSTIAGNWHTYNVTADIAGIVGSLINISTIVGPTISTTDSIIYNSDIIDSTILRCNISDSEVNGTDCTDAVIDPSDIKDSNITDSEITDSHVWYSNVTDSNVTDGTIDYSDIDDSNVSSSTLFNSEVQTCAIEGSNLTGSICDDSIIELSLDIVDTNATDSYINNSHIWHSNITNSNITDSTVDYADIDNSNIINGADVENSTISNSTIDDATISNSTVTNSTITNSSIFDAIVLNANITDDVLVSGNITWQGITTQGPKNLTDAVNYPPNAISIPTSASGTDSVTVIFNGTTSTDPNIPGDLNDYLNYSWDFTTDGTPDNFSNVTTYTYTSSATATLTVTDKFGKSDSTTIPITVSSGTTYYPSGGGGGGRRTTSYASVPIQLTDVGIYICLRLNEAAAFTFDQIAYTMTLKQFGTTYALLNIPGIEGNTLSGDLYIEKNESTKFDLNNNGYFDFYMKFNATTQSAACFDIRSIYEEMAPEEPQILEPSTEIPEPTEETLQRPARPRPSPRPREPAPAFKEEKPSPITDILIKVLPIALLAVALLGVVLHKMSGVMIKAKMPPIDVHIAKSLAKGKHLHEVHTELLQKGWSEDSIYAAELKHVIMNASKKMNLKQVHDELVKKGWPEDMVKSAVLGHFIRAHIAKGKSFEYAKAKLLKSGWKEEDIHQHLKKAK